MEEQSISEQLIEFFDQIKKYLNLRIDYLKLNAAEYMIKFFSSLTLWIIIFWIAFFAVFFASFAFAYWFGERTGQWALGFLIVAGFYVVMALLVFLLRKYIIVRPYTNMILKQFELDNLKGKENEDI